MAQCPPCQPLLNCSDSPLSWAGNIIGIATFAYALLATVWLYVSRIRSADVEQRKLLDTAWANYIRWKLMVNEYEDQLKAGNDINGDFKELLKHRFETGGEAMHRLDLALDYNPVAGSVTRTRQKGKFAVSQRRLHEMLEAANQATEDVNVLLDGITQEQMHRDLKLQSILLQEVAKKLGISKETTAEMRAVVDAAPEGVPIASLLPALTSEVETPTTVSIHEGEKQIHNEQSSIRSDVESGT